VIDYGKFNLLGVQVDAVDYDGAVARIVDAAREGRPLTVSALAVHGVMTGVLDAKHRYRLNRFDLLCPDGQPVRWGLNLLYRVKLRDRVYGPDLMLEVCRAAAAEELPVFLLGGRRELLDKLVERLPQLASGLSIAGTRESKFRRLTRAEWKELVDEIRGSGARILFVGLGCPRQEVFAFEAREAVSMPTLAVGAAFNFHSGVLPQAPPSLQRWGLEWLYRLVQEPRRLWRRYLLLNPAYLSLLALQKLGVHRIEPKRLSSPPPELLYG